MNSKSFRRSIVMGSGQKDWRSDVRASQIAKNLCNDLTVSALTDVRSRLVLRFRHETRAFQVESDGCRALVCPRIVTSSSLARSEGLLIGGLAEWESRFRLQRSNAGRLGAAS